MKRRSDWPERLSALIESRRMAPFSYGTNDCCLFAADAVLAMTDTDLAAAHRGQYATEFGAARVVATGGSLRALAAVLVEKQKGFAQRGDIVVAAVDGQEMLGVYIGRGLWCAPGGERLIFRPMSDVTSVLGV